MKQGSSRWLRASGSSTQFDHGKVPTSFEVAHRETDVVPAGIPTTSSVWPLRSRFESPPSPRSTCVDFARRLSDESHVRPQRVVPDRVQSDLTPHRLDRQRNQKAPCALLLHRPDETFDNGDARGFTDAPVARTDTSALAPGLEAAAPELRASVGDHVLGCASAHLDGTIKEALDLVR